LSENPTWSVSLAHSSNMQEPIDPLPYAFSLTPTFNRPGSFSMTLPLDDEIAYQVVKHSTCVICERNEAPKWSGSRRQRGQGPRGDDADDLGARVARRAQPELPVGQDEPLASSSTCPAGRSPHADRRS
jgi:hypothetical protein